MINLEGKKILIVEDDEMNFIYLKQIFKLTKGEIYRVKTGKAGIEQSQKDNYDIILMDIQLPDINGMDATREIRKHSPNIPILAQTAAKNPEEIDEILASGCNKVIIKPFKFEEITETLAKFFQAY